MNFVVKSKVSAKNLLTEFDKINSLFKDFKQGIGALSDSNIIAQLESGLSVLYKRCWALYKDKKSKISSEMEQVACVEIDPSDTVSQVELCSAVSSSTSARRIELRRERVKAEALRDLEPVIAKTKTAAAEEERLSERGFTVCLVPANII